MSSKLFVELIFKHPGITSEEISARLEMNIITVRKHLRRTMSNHPCFHFQNNGGEKAEVYLLERQKGSHSPYEYHYKKITSARLDLSV